MKSIAEIKLHPNIIICDHSVDGGIASVRISSIRLAKVIFSTGCGWDHVSVSFPDRCCTWEEMCRVKDMFFREDECVVQYHPPKSQYVNNHPYVLHLWRPQNESVPMPPVWMV